MKRERVAWTTVRAAFGAACITVARSLAASILLAFPGAAWPAATDVSIPMEQPPAAPRILGPSVVAARPGSSLLYTVPATGQAPLAFSAAGLPAGLTISARKRHAALTRVVAREDSFDPGGVPVAGLGVRLARIRKART